MAFHGPSYGLDADLQKKLAEKYDTALDAKVRAWISQVTGEQITDLHENLKSGVTLCNLLNKLKPGSVKNIQKGKAPFIQMVSSSSFIYFLFDINSMYSRLHHYYIDTNPPFTSGKHQFLPFRLQSSWTPSH
jgi:hypothetical protein